jgi:uncharacterized protein (UPF0261 family)
MAAVVLIGTLDTKGDEYAFVQRLIEAHGCTTLVIDVGVMPARSSKVDIAADEVAAAGGADIETLRSGNDRGMAMEVMAKGAAETVRKLYRKGKLDAVLALGGSGGTSIASAAMRALPIGVPKLMVSTVAAGDVTSYVGTSDIMMLYPVIDIAGLNIISERVLSNAAVAVAAMAKTAAKAGLVKATRPVVAITMFGVTTPAVTVARTWFEDAGYEVLVFSANGAGGRAMEALMSDGVIKGVLDLTTTELADELVGGILSAGPDRLEAAGALGLPQVVSLGALDMVNFGAIGTVPEKFKDRRLYRHNPHVTLMRTSPRECSELGALLARKLNRAKGPVTVFVPLRGTSSISIEGGVFHDAEADRALIAGLKDNLDPAIACVTSDAAINDKDFALAMARELDAHMKKDAKK